MQQSNAPSKLILPFANSGGKNAIPVASQVGITAGAASLEDGFPPLTRTPIAAGGVPPSGLDMNGILYELSSLLRWYNAGGGFVFDAAFAGDTNVGGYPKGARVLRSDGAGYWLNTIDGNTVDPESVTAGQAALAGWVPDTTNGVAAVAISNANVTLTPLQYGKPVIVLSGALTANLNLIFPNIAGQWTIVNNCTGDFSVTAKTADGTGVTLPTKRTRMVWGDNTNLYSSAGDPGNYSGVVARTASVALTAADAGKLILFGLTNTSAATCTLPAASSLAEGTVFRIQNLASGAAQNNLTLSAPSGTTLSGTSIGATSSQTFLMSPGTYVDVVAQGSVNQYQVIGGSGAASLGANGWFKHPNGVIEQWGRVTQSSNTQAVTFPIAFPNQCRVVHTTRVDTQSASGNTATTASGITPTGFNLNQATVPATANWTAIGY